MWNHFHLETQIHGPLSQFGLGSLVHGRDGYNHGHNVVAMDETFAEHLGGQINRNSLDGGVDLFEIVIHKSDNLILAFGILHNDVVGEHAAAPGSENQHLLLVGDVVPLVILVIDTPRDQSGDRLDHQHHQHIVQNGSVLREIEVSVRREQPAGQIPEEQQQHQSPDCHRKQPPQIPKSGVTEHSLVGAENQKHDGIYQQQNGQIVGHMVIVCDQIAVHQAGGVICDHNHQQVRHEYPNAGKGVVGIFFYQFVEKLKKNMVYHLFYLPIERLHFSKIFFITKTFPIYSNHKHLQFHHSGGCSAPNMQMYMKNQYVFTWDGKKISGRETKRGAPWKRRLLFQNSHGCATLKQVDNLFRSPLYITEKLSLLIPHKGQVQSSGSSSKGVPGAIPLSGSPFSGSYT